MSSLGSGKTSKLVWDISELNKINRFFKELKKRGQQAMRGELGRIADDIIKAARENAPELSGRLKKSGRKESKTKANKNKFDTLVMFGGISVANQTGRGKPGSIFVDYAALVETSHPTKSRYLEKAFNEMLPKIEGRIIRAVKDHFKKGFSI